jgi:hypothetical protein
MKALMLPRKGRQEVIWDFSPGLISKPAWPGLVHTPLACTQPPTYHGPDAARVEMTGLTRRIKDFIHLIHQVSRAWTK